jgi:hypothetical protein
MLALGGATAQTSTAPGLGSKDQNAPAHFDSQAQMRPNETLSERLDRTNGVIRPPAHVDPEIHETPPPTGDREIVVPPATGNKPAVTPK